MIKTKLYMKRYIKPITKVVRIPMEAELLAGSVPHLNGKSDQSGNPNDARSKSNEWNADADTLSFGF